MGNFIIVNSGNRNKLKDFHGLRRTTEGMLYTTLKVNKDEILYSKFFEEGKSD